MRPRWPRRASAARTARSRSCYPWHAAAVRGCRSHCAAPAAQRSGCPGPAPPGTPRVATRRAPRTRRGSRCSEAGTRRRLQEHRPPQTSRRARE
eukprot:scaffold30005_cov66-Phaeocystis_antarctica.AAC.9